MQRSGLTGLWLLAGILVTSMATATPAAAFSCAIPAVQSAAKRTVCFSKALRKLNGRERDGYAALARDLKGAARDAVIDDHWTFLEVLEACKSDRRCLDATYTAQLRLYDMLGSCKAKPPGDACAPSTIEKHRQALHKSM